MRKEGRRMLKSKRVEAQEDPSILDWGVSSGAGKGPLPGYWAR